jgi:hypothetical protein
MILALKTEGNGDMKRVYDITDKLTFAEPPVIKIKDVELTVDDSATTAIKMMSLIGNGEEMTADAVLECATLIFGKDGLKKLEKLKLSLNDFMTLVMEASDLIVGGEQGEAQAMQDMT